MYFKTFHDVRIVFCTSQEMDLTFTYFVFCAVDAAYGDVTTCQQMVRLFCNAQSCGRPTKEPNPNNILSKVVNGDFGDIEAWPWMASLQRVGARLQSVCARLHVAGAPCSGKIHVRRW